MTRGLSWSQNLPNGTLITSNFYDKSTLVDIVLTRGGLANRFSYLSKKELVLFFRLARVLFYYPNSNYSWPAAWQIYNLILKRSGLPTVKKLCFVNNTEARDTCNSFKADYDLNYFFSKKTPKRAIFSWWVVSLANASFGSTVNTYRISRKRPKIQGLMTLNQTLFKLPQ